MKNAIAGFLAACAVAVLILAVPGDAQVYVDGTPTCGGAIDGTGRILPAGTSITLFSADGTKSGAFTQQNSGWLDLPTQTELISATGLFRLRTVTDASVTWDAVNGYFFLNSAIGTTLAMGYVRTDLNDSTVPIQWGYGENLSHVLGQDTQTHVSGYNRHTWVHPKFNPASGSGAWAAWEINPTITGVSTGASTLLALAGNGTTTGGTTNCVDLGSTTTDFNTGYTSKLKVNCANGKATYPTGAADAIVGRSALTSGTVTVSTTSITASSVVMLTRCVAGGTVGVPQLGTVTAGTSFVINSVQPGTASTVQAADTGTICWRIDN